MISKFSARLAHSLVGRLLIVFSLLIGMLLSIGANQVLAAPSLLLSCPQVAPGGTLHFTGSGLSAIPNELVINWSTAGKQDQAPYGPSHPIDNAGNLSLDFPVPTTTPGAYVITFDFGQPGTGAAKSWNITVTSSPNCSSSQPSPQPTPTPQPSSGGSLPPGCTLILVDNPGRTGGGSFCPQQPSTPSPSTSIPTAPKPTPSAPSGCQNCYVPVASQAPPTVSVPINPEQPVDPGQCANTGVYLGANGSSCGTSSTQPTTPSNTPSAGATGTFPSAPGNVSVFLNPPSQVCVSWNGIDGANRYKVYDGSGNFIESAAVANTPKCFPSGVVTCFIVSAVTNNGETAKSAPVCVGGTASPSGGQVPGTSTGPATAPLGGIWLRPNDGDSFGLGDTIGFAANAYGGSGIDHVNFTIRPNINEPHDWFTACIAYSGGSDVFTCKWQIPSTVALGTAQIGFDVYDKSGQRKDSPNGLHAISISSTPSTMRNSSPLIVLMPGTINPLPALAGLDQGIVENAPQNLIASLAGTMPDTSADIQQLWTTRAIGDAVDPFSSLLYPDLAQIYQQYTCYSSVNRINAFYGIPNGGTALIPALQAAHISTSRHLTFNYGTDPNGPCKAGEYRVIDTFDDPGVLAGRLQSQVQDDINQNGMPSAIYVFAHSGAGVIAAEWAKRYTFNIPVKVFALDSPLGGCQDSAGGVAKTICDFGPFVTPAAAKAISWYHNSYYPLRANVYAIANDQDNYVTAAWALPEAYRSDCQHGFLIDEPTGDSWPWHGSVFHSTGAMQWIVKMLDPNALSSC